MVYDVSVDRVDKVRKFLKQHLNWVQNSAFEGELTEGELEKVRIGLGQIIEKSQDSILIFTTSNRKWLKKEVLGIEKSEVSRII